MHVFRASPQYGQLFLPGFATILCRRCGAWVCWAFKWTAGVSAAYSVVVVRRVILHAYSMYVCTCFDNQNENNNRGGQNLLSVAHLCRRALSTYYPILFVASLQAEKSNEMVNV